MRIDGGAEDDFLKKVDGKVLGAGERHKHSAGIEMLKRVQIEKFISAGSGIEVGSFMRQRRRVQDDQVEFPVYLLQVGKGVAFENFPRRVSEAV